MNKAQRAYYATLQQFKPAPKNDTPKATVETGGQYKWRWKCAGCGSPCIGEPIERRGNKWFCYCANDWRVFHSFHRCDERTPET